MPLKLKRTEGISLFLDGIAEDSNLPQVRLMQCTLIHLYGLGSFTRQRFKYVEVWLCFQNVRDQALGLTEGEELSWRALRDLVQTVRYTSLPKNLSRRLQITFICSLCSTHLLGKIQHKATGISAQCKETSHVQG